MTKTIISPVEQFPGSVVLPDFLTLLQVIAFEEANEKITELRESVPEGGSVKRSRLDQINLPVILAIVEEWRIVGIDEKPTIERMPLTPRLASAKLISWLVGEITRLYIGENEIPNA